MDLIYQDNINIKPVILTESMYLTVGQWYSQQNVDKSYKRLSGFNNFQTISIQFKESQQLNIDTVNGMPLDCEIKLVPYSRQSYKIEVEGTNTGNNIGFGGNLIYQHKNLFKGIENLDISFNGALVFVEQTDTQKLVFNTAVETGVESRLTFQEFLLPFKTERFIKKYHPKTSVSFAYNYQRQIFYTGTFYTARFGYFWQAGEYLTHSVVPFELNAVKGGITNIEFYNSLTPIQRFNIVRTL
ncbi:MAG: hypothetical protein HC896_17710 [Bacteroidales bacterium]|nr:hypothetical protein [Bacteroidales bacterium]